MNATIYLSAPTDDRKKVWHLCVVYEGETRSTFTVPVLEAEALRMKAAGVPEIEVI